MLQFWGSKLKVGLCLYIDLVMRVNSPVLGRNYYGTCLRTQSTVESDPQHGYLPGVR